MVGIICDFKVVGVPKPHSHFQIRIDDELEIYKIKLLVRHITRVKPQFMSNLIFRGKCLSNESKFSSICFRPQKDVITVMYSAAGRFDFFDYDKGKIILISDNFDFSERVKRLGELVGFELLHIQNRTDILSMIESGNMMRMQVKYSILDFNIHEEMGGIEIMSELKNHLLDTIFIGLYEKLNQFTEKYKQLGFKCCLEKSQFFEEFYWLIFSFEISKIQKQIENI